jgi:hypothetical protein
VSPITRFRPQAAAKAQPAPANATHAAAKPQPAAGNADTAAEPTEPADDGTAGAQRPERRRPRISIALTIVAAGIVFVALVVPDTLGRPHSARFLGAFLRIPVEGLAGAILLMFLPTRLRRVGAVLLGAGLGALTLLKMIDMGFRTVLARQFDPVLDLPLFGNGYDYLHETVGAAAAVAILIGTVVLVLAGITVLVLAVLRLADLAARHRAPAGRALAGLLAVWVAFALIGTTVYKGAPVASTSTISLAEATVKQVPKSLHDQSVFAAEARRDAFATVPPSRLLSGLRGKDVVISVVESYGRSALENRAMAKVVNPALTVGAQQLTDAGFAARSGWLTSSTFGGGSWLAHASFQSGLWINNQGRYRQLVAGDRLTLTNAFHRAGWQTVGLEPGNHHAWPEASFYGYDRIFDSRNLGYQGPQFGWSSIPDQFTLGSFQKNVYGRKHGPLMAEITLTSSHSPWTVIPRMVDWKALGDGSIFAPMAKTARDRTTMWQKHSQVRAGYARSIAYTMTALTSWASTYGDDNLVLIFFGDHQPVTTVSGANASHDIPITIVARDRSVLDRIAGWGWADGIKPSPATPVWKMSEFRDRFLTAFGTPTAGRH